jgi:hypothetical protein
MFRYYKCHFKEEPCFIISNTDDGINFAVAISLNNTLLYKGDAYGLVFQDAFGDFYEAKEKDVPEDILAKALLLMHI